MSWPIPATTDDTATFWTGGREGHLMITTCDDCGRRTHPPSPRCAYCFSENVAPQPVSGRGRVYSFTINRRQWQPGLDVPYVIAVVELDEQSDVRLLTNVVDCPPEEVHIGMPVEVLFEERGPVFLPIFRRAA
jgi:uncharacterized OB-fold protein